ncbi:MAG: Hsp70 family protein, partial [Burkholderiaceae bacterium]
LRVEEGKIALSDSQEAQLNLDRLVPAEMLTLHRTAFDSAVSHLVTSIEKTVTDLLRGANIAAGKVDTIFFTGGSSGVPLLRERISALLPDARRVEGDLFGSIGVGLALDAARKFG